VRAAPRNKLAHVFLPDTGIITGAPLTVAEAAKIADRVGASTTAVRIVVEDRTSEEADWL
jgi:hypothetical protein